MSRPRFKPGDEMVLRLSRFLVRIDAIRDMRGTWMKCWGYDVTRVDDGEFRAFMCEYDLEPKSAVDRLGELASPADARPG